MMLIVGILPYGESSAIQPQLKADVGEYTDEEYAEMMQYYTLTPPDPVVAQAFQQLIVPQPEPEYDEEAMINMYIYILGYNPFE